MLLTKNILKKKIQNLILPSSYSNELAEETGIHIGDGSMYLYKEKYGVYCFSGHEHDDIQFSIYFIHLMKKLYNLWPSYEKTRKNTRMIEYTRNDLVFFKEKLEQFQNRIAMLRHGYIPPPVYKV